MVIPWALRESARANLSAPIPRQEVKLTLILVEAEYTTTPALHCADVVLHTCESPFHLETAHATLGFDPDYLPCVCED